MTDRGTGRTTLQLRTASSPMLSPAPPAMTPAMTLNEQIERMAAEQALSDVEQEAKVR